MVEKYSATQTQVATKVSTKTKVLLGLVIAGCLGGMFAIAGMLSPKQPISDSVSKAMPDGSKLGISIAETKEEQYNKISTELGVSADVIKQCVESEGQECPAQIRDIISVKCLCAGASCGFEANFCSTCRGHNTCTVTCGSGNSTWTETGRCRTSVGIWFMGTMVYF